MEKSELIHQQLRNLRENPELARNQKQFILEVLEQEDLPEKTRAIAMGIVSDHQWSEALPLARKLAITESKYTGLQDAAIRGLGILGSNSIDQTFLQNLQAALEKVPQRGVEGRVKQLENSISKANLQINKRLQESTAEPIRKTPSPPCCTSQDRDQWRQDLRSGEDGLKRTLFLMVSTFEQRNCQRMADEISLLIFRFNFVQQNERRGKLTLEQVSTQKTTILDHTLSLLSDWVDQ